MLDATLQSKTTYMHTCGHIQIHTYTYIYIRGRERKRRTWFPSSERRKSLCLEVKREEKLDLEVLTESPLKAHKSSIFFGGNSTNSSFLIPHLKPFFPTLFLSNLFNTELSFLQAISSLRLIFSALFRETYHACPHTCT